MTDPQFNPLGSESAPADWVLPGSLELTPKVVFASFDGTSAAGSFLPCLELIDDSGRVVGSFPTTTQVAAGASADVTWFRGAVTASDTDWTYITTGPSLVASVTNPTDWLSFGLIAISSDQHLFIATFKVEALSTFTAGSGDYSLVWANAPTGFVDDRSFLLTGYLATAFNTINSVNPITGKDSTNADGLVNLYYYRGDNASLNTYTAADAPTNTGAIIASGFMWGSPRTVVLP